MILQSKNRKAITATYRTPLVLNAPPAQEKPLLLNLGDVRDLASATLSGYDATARAA